MIAIVKGKDWHMAGNSIEHLSSHACNRDVRYCINGNKREDLSVSAHSCKQPAKQPCDVIV